MDAHGSFGWPLDPSSPSSAPGLCQVLADLTDSAVRMEALWGVIDDGGLAALHFESACAAVQLALVELRQCLDPLVYGDWSEDNRPQAGLAPA